jgi:hypothetical protein
MDMLRSDIFHLVRAKGVLRKAIAFCGLVAMLLTVSCGPTPSDSNQIPVPKMSEYEESDSSGIEVLPEAIPQAKPVAQTHIKETEVTEIEPPLAPSIPEANSNTQSTSQAPSLTQDGGNSAHTGAGSDGSTKTTTGSGSAVNEAIRAIVERLNANFLWAMMPTYIDTHKDANGQVHEHFKVSSGKSQELKSVLAKMRDDLVVRGSDGERFEFEIKEQGTCSNENKEASTKSCDTSAPICLSLEAIKAQSPNEDLEQALRPLVMREFARQHCADEALAKQVENYYNLSAIKNFKATNRVASIFNRVRLNLVYLQAALTTGITPNAGKYAQKIDSKEEICNMITQGAAQALVLQDQVITSGFVKDPESSVKVPRVVLTETLKSMSTFCDGNSLDRQALLQPLNQAIKNYDQLAQEFSKNSRMIVIDFSKHLWAH